VAIGNVNGDSYGDVVMGCYRYDGDVYAGIGSAVVFTRNTPNTGFDAGVDLYHPDPEYQDYCGIEVAVSDINNDGRGDVFMSCYLDDDEYANQGSVVLFARNSVNTGFDSGTALYGRITLTASNDHCGTGLALGDVNGDGEADDLAMGCQGYGTGTYNGGMYVLEGVGDSYVIGRLGIGTQTPQHALDVRGNAYVSGTLEVRDDILVRQIAQRDSAVTDEVYTLKRYVGEFNKERETTTEAWTIDEAIMIELCDNTTKLGGCRISLFNYGVPYVTGQTRTDCILNYDNVSGFWYRGGEGGSGVGDSTGTNNDGSNEVIISTDFCYFRDGEGTGSTDATDDFSFYLINRHCVLIIEG
jgi:hypothetical protein